MNKDDRKFEILYAIIKDYIHTAEPVGSRTIEKKYNLGISSATIRNEMADLEDMGYLIQPHTSSGRIPSDKAYRLYVDHFMQVFDLDENITDDLRLQYQSYIGELNQTMQKTAEILTKLTNLTSVVMAPSISDLNIKEIRLIHIVAEKVLLVVITNQGIVKSTELLLAAIPTSAQLEKISNFLNLCLKSTDSGWNVANFTSNIELLDHAEQRLLGEIMPAIKQTLRQDNKSQVYASGITEIFKYPEFQSMNKAKRFLETLHKQDLLSHLLFEMMDSDEGIRIGNENEVEELNDCSIITATYKLNGRPVGSIGIVGPTRMDYDYCVSVIRTMTRELTNHITDMTEDGNG